LIAGLLALGPGVRTASAQGQPFQTTSPGLNVGRFLIYPSLSVDLMQDSNVRYASEELPSAGDLGSGEIMVRPRVLVDLPIGQGRVRWVYAPLYRNYTSNTFKLPRRLSHNFDLEAGFKVGSAVRLLLRDHYVRGVLELEEVDRGGELAFGLTPFTSQEPSLQLDVDLGARQGISVLPRFDRVQFNDTPDAALLSFNRDQLEGRYNVRLSPTDVLYGFYASESSNQRRGSAVFADLTMSGESFGLGATRTLNELVTMSMSWGYKRFNFKGGDAEDFAGAVTDVNASLQLSDRSSLALLAGRQPFESFFLDNSFYLDNQLGFQFLQQVGVNAYWSAGATVRSNVYSGRVNLSVRPDTPATEDCNHDGVLDGSDCDQNNVIDSLQSLYCVQRSDGSLDCPSQGTRRRDRVLHFEVGAGYRLRRNLRVFIGYNADRRRSNVEQVNDGVFYDPNDYNIHRVFFRVEMGWL